MISSMLIVFLGNIYVVLVSYHIKSNFFTDENINAYRNMYEVHWLILGCGTYKINKETY